MISPTISKPHCFVYLRHFFYFATMNQRYTFAVLLLTFNVCLSIGAHLKKAETDVVLKATLSSLEKSGITQQRFDSLMTVADQKVHQKFLSIENTLKRLNISQKPHETFYQSLTFTQVLDLVLKNLRAQGQYALANQIQELALYVIGLERIKASGVYAGTEMERTLDRNIQENKAKLIAIINALIRT